MKVVLLAGGFGTRISEESQLCPKPMVEIGGKPIIWHIMKYFSNFGYNEFIICAGYKQEIIKQWFKNYFINTSDITFDFTVEENVIVHNQHSEKWKVSIVDTGLNTMTGGRIKRIKDYVGNEPFFMTYGDGVATVDLNDLLKISNNTDSIATISTVHIKSKFGSIEFSNNNRVKAFREKSDDDGLWINGGYMVLKPEIFDYIDGDDTIFEREPLERLVNEKKLYAYKHNGFWQCMDTMRDRKYLEKLIEDNIAPWMVWNND